MVEPPESTSRYETALLSLQRRAEDGSDAERSFYAKAGPLAAVLAL
jgi:hypothetical protein